MITDQLSVLLRQAVDSAVKDGELTVGDEPIVITFDTPKNKDFGDFATNVAMLLQKRAGLAPREIANRIIKRLPVGQSLITRVEIAGPGFMNFYLNPVWLYDTMVSIEREDTAYGNGNSRSGERTLIEFVSANPTGPISVVNGRAAALGDCLANLLSAAGAVVEREFYINDALNSTQINLMGISLQLRYLQTLGHTLDMGDSSTDEEEESTPHACAKCGENHIFPKEGYRGEYLVEIAEQMAKEDNGALAALPATDQAAKFRQLASDRMILQQQSDLAAFGVKFDKWFYESSLYEKGEVSTAIELMKSKGYAYEKDGALWLKTTELSKDDQDRVLVRSNDKETYISADAAYHKNKFDRGFNRLINIWGADHHGYVQRLKAGVSSLGYDQDKCEIILTQMILLMRDGEPVRGSKRAGDIIPLVDLVNEIGRDAARYYCLLNSYETTATFDLELAKRQSSDNPVFYAQYAHARAASLLAQAISRGVEIKAAADIDLTLLTDERELGLLRKLSDFPSEVKLAGDFLAPHRLTGYIREVGQALHQFYEECPTLKEGVDPAVRDARIALFNVTRIVVRNLLALLGVSAPDKM